MKEMKRIAIVFSGGPAPAANAVIGAAAISFLEAGVEVLGIFHGYTNLQDYDPERAIPWSRVKHYRVLVHSRRHSGDLRNTPRHHHRDRARQPWCRPSRRPPTYFDPVKTERLVAPSTMRAGRPRRRRTDFDRGRRHAQDGELPLSNTKRHQVPEGSAGSRSFTCPRRSTTTTAGSISPSATSPPSR